MQKDYKRGSIMVKNSRLIGLSILVGLIVLVTSCSICFRHKEQMLAEKVARDIEENQRAFLIGLGALFIGLNIVRYFYSQKISKFWSVIGFILIVIGLGEFFSLEIPVIPVVIIVIGISMILKPLLRKK